MQFGDAVSPVEPPESYCGALRFLLCRATRPCRFLAPDHLAHAAYGLYLDGRMLVDWEQRPRKRRTAEIAPEAALETFIARLAPCAVVYENEGSSVGSKFIAAKAGSLFSRVDEAIGRVALVVASEVERELARPLHPPENRGMLPSMGEEGLTSRPRKPARRLRSPVEGTWFAVHRSIPVATGLA